MKTPHTIFLQEKMLLLSGKKKVLDVGGGKRFQKWLKEYEGLFVHTDFKTLDLDPRTEADVVGDIHAIPLPNESIDSIICSSVLEHVRDPAQAVRELHRILKKGGSIFVYVPSIYPYHARKGSYPDYWRFFDDTLTVLFSDFTSIEIVKTGGYFRALSFFVPFQSSMRGFLDFISHWLDTFCARKTRATTSGYYLYAEK